MSTTPEGADRSRSAVGSRRTRRGDALESRRGRGERQRTAAEPASLLALLAHTADSDAAGEDLAARLRDRSGADVALVLAAGTGGEEFAQAASRGLDSAEQRGSLLALARRAAAWAVRAKEPLLVPRPAEDPRLREAAPGDVSLVQAVPLVAFSRPLGAAVLVWREDRGVPDPPLWNAALRELAPAAALWLGQRILAREAGEAAGRLRESEILIRRGERARAAIDLLRDAGDGLRSALAGLGELHARIGAEPRAEARAGLLALAGETAARIEQLLACALEAGRAGEGGSGAVDVNQILEDAVEQLGTTAERERVRLRVKCGASVPPLVLDAARFRRMLVHLLAHLVRGAAPGGRVRAETVRRGDLVRLTLQADGPRGPGGSLALLWTCFSAADGESVSEESAVDLLRRYHGRIETGANAEWAAWVRVELPLAVNRDRRRRRDERRGRDRRAA